MSKQPFGEKRNKRLCSSPNGLHFQIESIVRCKQICLSISLKKLSGQKCGQYMGLLIFLTNSYAHIKAPRCFF